MWQAVFGILFNLVLVFAVADRACVDRGGDCMFWPTNSCSAGWESNHTVCKGGSNRRCCKNCDESCLENEALWTSEDSKCNAAKGSCQDISNYCNGDYVEGLCGGPAHRQCCNPKKNPEGFCPLVIYKSTPHLKGFDNFEIRVHPDFVKSMDIISNISQNCNIVAHVTFSFRKKKQRKVAPSRPVMSLTSRNHLVGHAIDVNLNTTRGWCSGNCMLVRINPDAKCFTDGIMEAGLHWGGRSIPPDAVHVDDRFDSINFDGWKALLNELQPVC